MKIHIILGSTRQGRFGEKPASWILELAKKRKDLEVELVDLRDYPLPFFNEAKSPSMITEPYADPQVKKWTDKVAEADGYIFVTPEYNHGYPAVLKNALDYVGKEWHKKAVAFVSYGSVGGARAIEQLRQVMVELQMASVKQSIHIPGMMYVAALKDAPAIAFAPLEPMVEAMLDQLTWWATALKNARDQE